MSSWNTTTTTTTAEIASASGNGATFLSLGPSQQELKTDGWKLVHRDLTSMHSFGPWHTDRVLYPCENDGIYLLYFCRNRLDCVEWSPARYDEDARWIRVTALGPIVHHYGGVISGALAMYSRGEAPEFPAPAKAWAAQRAQDEAWEAQRAQDDKMHKQEDSNTPASNCCAIQ